MDTFDLKDKVNEWLSEAKTKLVDNYKLYGLKASGKWESELSANVVETQSGIKATIEGAYYTYWMENGRGPNIDQSPKGLRAWVGWAGSTFLKTWCENKGLPGSLSYAVAYKIALHGIKVPNNHNPGGLVENSINETLIKKLQENISVVFQQKLKSDVILVLKNK
jgi:hypothetical protein